MHVKCRSHEDYQERKMVVETGEEFSQEGATHIKDECVLMQVCPCEGTQMMQRSTRVF